MHWEPHANGLRQQLFSILEDRHGTRIKLPTKGRMAYSRSPKQANPVETGSSAPLQASSWPSGRPTPLAMLGPLQMRLREHETLAPGAVSGETNRIVRFQQHWAAERQESGAEPAATRIETPAMEIKEGLRPRASPSRSLNSQECDKGASLGPRSTRPKSALFLCHAGCATPPSPPLPTGPRTLGPSGWENTLFSQYFLVQYERDQRDRLEGLVGKCAVLTSQLGP